MGGGGGRRMVNEDDVFACIKPASHGSTLISHSHNFLNLFLILVCLEG